MPTPKKMGLSLRVSLLAAFVVVGSSWYPSPALFSYVPGVASPGSHSQQPAQLALIIAIADYPEEVTGVKPLNSQNDVPLVRGALEAQGFHPDHIQVLRDSVATREGIVAAIQNHLLKNAQPGDVVFLHFSGHGQRLTDNDGDELDGYDEALVPFDAPANPPEDYSGELHLRDDELGVLLQKLKDAVSPSGNVVFAIDACFSGSATRSAKGVAVRGVPEPIGPPADRTSLGRPERGGGFVEGGGAQARGASGAEGSATYVVFSASRHDEPSWETLGPDGRPVGSLSFALSQAIAESRPGSTYRDLFERVKKRMLITAPLQTPQMEGDQDTEVFGGKTVEQVPYFQVRSTSGDSMAIVGGGQLAGILPGTELAFHPPESHDPSTTEPLGSGTVTRVDPLRAEVVLREPMDPEILKTSRGFITSRAFGDFKVGLRLEGLSVEDLTVFEKELLTVGSVRIVTESPDLVVRPFKTGNGLVLSSGWDDSVLLSSSAPDIRVRVSEVVNRARSYAIGRLLKSTEMSSSEIQVSLTVLPALHRYRSDGTCDGSESVVHDPSPSLTEGGQLELSPGEGFLLELVNTGPSSAYVTVLNLSSTGELDQLFPRPDLGGDDNLLEAGASHRVGLCFSAPDQVGKEVLKLFATRERVNFEAVTKLDRTFRGQTFGTPLERLFAEALSGTRSSPSSGARTAGHTEMVSFSVVSSVQREWREDLRR